MRQRVDGKSPDVARSAYIHPSAMVIGEVTLGKQSSIWPGTVIRADLSPITIGERTNIQDGCVVHSGLRLQVHIGNGVLVGHKAMLHSCDIEDGALIGMGSIVMDAAKIGEHSIVGAGSLVPKGYVVPPRTVAVGSPCRVIREVTDEEIADIEERCERYINMAKKYVGTGEIL